MCNPKAWKYIIDLAQKPLASPFTVTRITLQWLDSMLAQFFVIPVFHIFLACKKPTVDCYIVHQTRFFLSALKSTLAIPPGIAISQLGNNIFLNSTTSKTVITLQLTCPSGENLESWHAFEFGKHDPLCLAIKRNGW